MFERNERVHIYTYKHTILSDREVRLRVKHVQRYLDEACSLIAEQLKVRYPLTFYTPQPP